MEDEIIRQTIIATLEGESHLGEHLKKRCIDYLKAIPEPKIDKVQNVLTNKEIALRLTEYYSPSEIFTNPNEVFKVYESLLERLEGTE